MAFGCDLCSNLEDRKLIMIKSFLSVAFAWSASGRAICEAYTDDGQLQLKASDLGHCAVYEKELQRLWPITEENRKTKIAEFAGKHGFRLAYYKQGHCAIFLDDPQARVRSPSAPRHEA